MYRRYDAIYDTIFITKCPFLVWFDSNVIPKCHCCYGSTYYRSNEILGFDHCLNMGIIRRSTFNNDRTNSCYVIIKCSPCLYLICLLFFDCIIEIDRYTCLMYLIFILQNINCSYYRDKYKTLPMPNYF